MPVITKQIRADAGVEHYTTITNWEADLGDTGVYSSGDDAVGECYDENYDEEILFTTAVVSGLSSIKLSVESTNRHDGTEGTGARIVRSSKTNDYIIRFDGESTPRYVEWLELDGNGQDYTYGFQYNTATFTNQIYLTNLIVHDITNTSGSSTAHAFYGQTGRAAYIANCFIYNITNYSGTSASASAIYQDTDQSWSGIYNNTIYNVVQENTGGGDAYGMYLVDASQSAVKNNIVVGIDDSGGGTAQCYYPSSPSNLTMDYNWASDTSAAGANSSGSKTTSIFVSTSPVDLHLAASNGEGQDLGNVLAKTDIDGRNRDSEGDTWDVGADQYVASSSGTELSGSTSIATTQTGGISQEVSISGSTAVATSQSGGISQEVSISGTTAIATAQTGELHIANTVLTGTTAIGTTQTGAISQSISISGTTSVSVTQTGAFTQEISVSGTTAISTTQSGAITQEVSLSGSTAVSTSHTGVMAQGNILSGTTLIELSQTGAMAQAVSVSGSTTVSTAQTGTFTQTVSISGATTISTSQTGAADTGDALLAGSSVIVTSQTGGVTQTISISGETSIVVTQTARLGGDVVGSDPSTRWRQDRLQPFSKASYSQEPFAT